MSKHNYSQYSNKKNNKPKVDEPEMQMVEEVVTTVTSPEVKMEVVAEAYMPEVMEETVETVELPKLITGTVANCMKLNVRVKPKSDADVLCVLDVKSEVEIDIDKSTKEWFYVSTAAGVDGYCMRQYINAKL